MFNLPSKIEYVLNTLCENGYEAYIVGGCVRDILLGKTPFDYDITTSALPEEVISIFPKTVPTGIKHGTVSVIVEKECIEVTTFRTEGNYSDQRHPDTVTFVRNLKDDLSRRDFTVNAMAYNKQKGLIDYFGGKDDLDNKILKTVGIAQERFNEDALRILRLFRFASVLDFKIEKETLNSAIMLFQSLESVSRERIFNELIKAISGKNIKALKPLTDKNALNFIGVTLKPDYYLLNQLNKSSLLALFSFLYFSSSNVLSVLESLKASNRQKKYCKDMLLLLSSKLPESKEETKILLCSYTPELIYDYFYFTKTAFNNDTSSSEQFLKEIIENDEPYLIKHLAITGEDIKALDFVGKSIGKKLKLLQKKVIAEPLLNEKNKLINILKHSNQ